MQIPPSSGKRQALPATGMNGAAPEQPLAAVARHCRNAEKAADDGRWDSAHCEVGAVQATLQDLLQYRALSDLDTAEIQLLTAIDGRIKRLRARAALALETTEQSLRSIRNQRTVAAAYRRHG
jgi:hypothetical protein